MQNLKEAGKIHLEKINIAIGEQNLNLTNLDKVFWPEEGYTKAHLLQYYSEISSYLLPHLRDYPLVLKRYPEGITGDFFYQKECPEYAPQWLTTALFPGKGKRPLIRYCLAQDLPSLLWLINQGCIEIHPWLSTRQYPNHPTAAVFDIDPDQGAGFSEVQKTALLLYEVIKKLKLKGYPKTSGAGGLHIYLPLGNRYTYPEVRQALSRIAAKVVRVWPQGCTLERSVNRREGRIYIDVSQNGEGKTIASVYSVRPYPGAPVSTPLSWDELLSGSVNPLNFNLNTLSQRLKVIGDLFAPVQKETQDLDPVLKM